MLIFKRQDLAGETREGRLELIQKASPELESCPPELPREPNKDNVQFPESISRPAEYQLSTVDVAEVRNHVCHLYTKRTVLKMSTQKVSTIAFNGSYSLE